MGAMRTKHARTESPPTVTSWATKETDGSTTARPTSRDKPWLRGVSHLGTPVAQRGQQPRVGAADSGGRAVGRGAGDGSSGGGGGVRQGAVSVGVVGDLRAVELL